MSNNPAPARLVALDVQAPRPLLRAGRVADSFNELRRVTLQFTGHDFLAVCGDIFRAKDFQSSKHGVAHRSWHKTGRAFDYNQADPNLYVEPERAGQHTFFRTFLRIEDGRARDPHSARRGFFDFTRAAEALGWRRIPAWRGWERTWNYREFWHYQLDEGLSWSDAMADVYGATELQRAQAADPETKEPRGPVVALASSITRDLGRNDRGGDVRVLQEALSALGLLGRAEIDGVFGLMTFSTLVEFQRKHQLAPDGMCGPKTRDAIAAALRNRPGK